MTLVVVQRDGLVVVYVRGADGELRQRAAIDAGRDETHAVLAEIGEGLSTRFEWNGVAPPKRSPVVTKRALEAPKRRVEPPKPKSPSRAARGRRVLPRGIIGGKLRPAWVEEVYEYVAANPGASNADLVEALDMGASTVEKLTRDLFASGRLERERDGRQVPYHFRAVPTEEDPSP